MHRQIKSLETSLLKALGGFRAMLSRAALFASSVFTDAARFLPGWRVGDVRDAGDAQVSSPLSVEVLPAEDSMVRLTRDGGVGGRGTGWGAGRTSAMLRRANGTRQQWEGPADLHHTPEGYMV